MKKPHKEHASAVLDTDFGEAEPTFQGDGEAPNLYKTKAYAVANAMGARVVRVERGKNRKPRLAAAVIHQRPPIHHVAARGLMSGVERELVRGEPRGAVVLHDPVINRRLLSRHE